MSFVGSRVDYDGDPTSYPPENLIDGQPDTAWRCDGDATGQSVTLTFAQPVHVSEIGLIPGFDKVDPGDGANRFVQGRQITQVTYVIGGRHIISSFQDVPTMQTTQVNLVTTQIHVIIDGTIAGSAITDDLGNQYAPVDKTAISEIEVFGAVGSN